MDEDIYYVDTRNADLRDHRVGVGIRPGSIVPARTVTLTPASTSSRVGYAPAGYPPAGAVMYPQPQVFGPAPVYAQGPGYGQPYGYGQPFMGQLGAMFGGLTIGDLANLVAQGFAAFKSLPAQPAPTGDVGTDLANDVLYQAALARELKLEKQIEFGGRVVGGLLGAR